MSARKKILGVIEDPNGVDNLDISYTPECITPAILKQIRAMDDDAPEEDAVREILVTWGLQWNLTSFVAPEAGDPTTDVKLSDEATLTVKADESGNPVKVPIPPTVEGMRTVPMRALWVVFNAIQDDARPKAPNSAS